MYSNNPFVNIFEYDTNEQTVNQIKTLKNKIQLNTIKTKTPVNLILAGDQSNAVPNLTLAY